MNSDEVVNSLMKRQNIKQDINVIELYLGKQSLTSVNSLRRFRMLQRLWLNSNKLRNLLSPVTQHCFLHHNFRITELHLQNNELCEIRGTLSHLRYLQVLMLQKNQLANLNEVLQELFPLQALHVLNLFDNPLAQEPGYRLLLVHTLPPVERLDRQEVTAKEKKQAREIYEANREAVKASIAFGRRADINPSLLHTLNRYQPSRSTITPAKYNVQTIRREMNLQSRRSVMQYTTFDWARIPSCEERRLGAAVPSPQNLTVKFR
ncbi:unnamed protein product [Clavelina lepadiformis]|uniref:Leucine-rich repeat-containing protein 72 n=1 Tax=Clavelina lepadiformis TaxID=159417 RepID=A0ABP0F6R4_CLALP